jgi:hypothetical protein
MHWGIAFLVLIVFLLFWAGDEVRRDGIPRFDEDDKDSLGDD